MDSNFIPKVDMGQNFNIKKYTYSPKSINNKKEAGQLNLLFIVDRLLKFIFFKGMIKIKIYLSSTF